MIQHRFVVLIKCSFNPCHYKMRNISLKLNVERKRCQQYCFKIHLCSLSLDNVLSATDIYTSEFSELKILCFKGMTTLTYARVKHKPFSKDLAALE